MKAYLRPIVITALLMLSQCLLFSVVNPIEAFAQDSTLRIFGISFPSAATRSSGSELLALPVTLSEDGRHARFRLTVSVRNYGTTSGRYKVQLIAAGRHSPASTVNEVAAGAVRRAPYEVDLDFGSASGAGASGAPTVTLVLPPNPVRAELLLFDQDGREVGRSAFNLILRAFPRPPARVTQRTDLRVENTQLIYSPARAEGLLRIRPSVRATATIRNVGTEIWGFRGEVSFNLQVGTPETGLTDLGDRGLPTYRYVPLPTGLSPTATQTVSTILETRFRSTTPPSTGRIIEVTPPLRPGVWYTLTVASASEADLDPSNDSERYIFILNDDMTVRESRTVRVTNRVRVLTH